MLGVTPILLLQAEHSFISSLYSSHEFHTIQNRDYIFSPAVGFLEVSLRTVGND
jgi:hypothetical protein